MKTATANQILTFVDSFSEAQHGIVKLGKDIVKLALVSVAAMLIMAFLRGPAHADDTVTVKVAKMSVIEQLKSFNKTLKAQSVCGTQGTHEFMEELTAGNQTAWACLELPLTATKTQLASK